MKKVTLTIPQGEFGTTNSKYPADSVFVGVNDFTDGSKNFETTDRGVITKSKGSIDYNPSLMTTAAKDQYEAIFADGVHHLLVVEGGRLRYSPGDGVLTTVTSGYSTAGNFEFTEYFDRVYFGNGIDNPQVYDRAASYGGVAYTAPKTKDMGAQAPGSAPTAGAPTAGGSVPNGTHTYKVTFLYYDFEESNGSPASGAQTAGAGNNTIPLTTIPIGGYGVTARKIYRDDNDGIYRLLTTLTNNTATTFSDTLATTSTLIPTDNFEPPDFTLILTHLDRIWVAGVPGDPVTIYFSSPGFPDIFPSDNSLLCNPRDPITAIVVYQDRIIVFNRNSMGQILGRTTDAFRYSEIPSSVGCVDTRSIQTRVINGIPVLLWLSDKGLYAYNGNSIDYISDPIEDLVNFNIQQAVQTKGRNAQTSQTDFAGGTASTGIDLDTFPGLITTRGPKNAGTGLPSDPLDPTNPTRTWNTQAEWEAGSSLTNLATKNGSLLQLPVRTIFDEAAGTFNSTILSGGSITLTSSTAFNGDTVTAFGSAQTASTGRKLAQKFTVPRAGTLTQIKVKLWGTINPGVNTTNTKLAVWSDSAGEPGAVLAENVVAQSVDWNETSGTIITLSTSISMFAGQILWLGISSHTVTAGGTTRRMATSTTSVFLDAKEFNTFTSGPWVDVGGQLEGWGFTFIYTPVVRSGQWTSTSYDSLSSAAQAATIRMSGSTPAVTTRVIKLQRSPDAVVWTDNEATVFNGNGPHTVAVGNQRYWRIVITMSTTDDVSVPTASDPELRFLTTGEWISEALDLTTGVTIYNALTAVSSIPAGSVTLTAASSADNISYTAFGAIGSITVQRYIKVKITLTTDASNIQTPAITSLTFNYTIVGNLVSSAIDTVTNFGWDIFQASFSTNGGTVLFEMRSATTEGGLGAASYFTVTNGAFPSSVPVNRWVQWRVTITSSVNDVPEVESVTINWFLNQTNSIRVASLFFNRDYYLSVAEFGNDTNNLILKFDGEGKWRIRREVNVSTMGLFFNEPFFGISTEGQIVKYLQGLVNPDGSNITLDVRTKAFDFSADGNFDTLEKTKILRVLYVILTNTGATPTFYASFDGGETFSALKDMATGSTTVTLTSDETRTMKRLVLDFNDTAVETQGKTIMFRVVDSSANDLQLHGLKAKVWIREGELVS